MDPLKTVVFMVASDTHLDMFIPIARYLKLNKGISSLVINRRLFDYSIDYPIEILKNNFDFIVNFEPSKRDIPKRLIFRIYDKIKRKLQKESIIELKLEELIENIVKNHQVLAVYFSNDRAFPDKQAVHHFNNANILTILMQESIRRDLSMPQKNYLSKNGQGGCNYVIAWGSTSLDYYKKVGVSKEKIKVLGNPRMDSFIEKAKLLNDVEIKKSLKIKDNIPIYLIASNPIHSMSIEGAMNKMEYLLNIDKTINLIKNHNPKSVIILKPHLLDTPYWNDLGLKEFYNKNPNVLINYEHSLEELIYISERVFIFNSTVALEAALLGIPSGIINFYNSIHGCDFAENNISKEIFIDEQMNDFLSETESNFGLTKKYLEIIDVKNTERFVEFILNETF